KSCLRRCDARLVAVLEETQEAEARLDPSSGMMMQAVWFDPGRLLLVVHHLSVDAVSWHILISDLAAAYEGVTLPPRSTSFRRWAERVSIEARRPERAAELPLWTSMLTEPVEPLHTPLAEPTAGHSHDVGHLQLQLTSGVATPLLSLVPTAFHARVSD